MRLIAPQVLNRCNVIFDRIQLASTVLLSPPLPPSTMVRLPPVFTRYDGYLPLHGQAPSRKRSFIALALVLLSVALVVTSVVLNIVFAVKLAHYTPRPLDDYQNL